MVSDVFNLHPYISDWMRGKEMTTQNERTALGMAVGSVKDSVVWNRQFSQENFQTKVREPLEFWGSGS